MAQARKPTQMLLMKPKQAPYAKLAKTSMGEIPLTAQLQQMSENL